MTETKELYTTNHYNWETQQMQQPNKCSAEWFCPSCHHPACCPLCPNRARGQRIGPSELKKYDGEGVA